jgi:two-component system response regulator AtoC
LNVVRIQVPPLRERREDIPLLADHFLAHFRDSLGRPVHGIADDALERITGYPWRGNVRELANVIERAVMLCEGERICIQDLPANVVAASTQTDASNPSDFSLKRARRAAEAQIIRRALRATNGNRTHAAKRLEISHRALLYKLKEYRIRD